MSPSVVSAVSVSALPLSLPPPLCCPARLCPLPALFNRLPVLCCARCIVLLVDCCVCSCCCLIVCWLVMLLFGRAPVLSAALTAAKGEAHVEEQKEQLGDEVGMQFRSRYYSRLSVLPAAPPGLPRRSSQPLSGVAAVPIPAASVSASSAVSRFARPNVLSSHSSHSLPSALRRSQPIDIPAVRRSMHAAAVTTTDAGKTVWHREAWQAAVEDTDGSSGSDGSESADDWFVGDRRQLSESFVDDSHLQWSGRCLEDESVEAGGAAVSQKQMKRWTSRPQPSDSDEDEDSSGEEDTALPFPLLAPSYHVDFELN